MSWWVRNVGAQDGTSQTSEPGSPISAANCIFWCASSWADWWNSNRKLETKQLYTTQWYISQGPQWLSYSPQAGRPRWTCPWAQARWSRVSCLGTNGSSTVACWCSGIIWKDELILGISCPSSRIYRNSSQSGCACPLTFAPGWNSDPRMSCSSYSSVRWLIYYSDNWMNCQNHKIMDEVADQKRSVSFWSTFYTRYFSQTNKTNKDELSFDIWWNDGRKMENLPFGKSPSVDFNISIFWPCKIDLLKV